MLNSPWYISGFQTLSPWRSHQGMVIVRLQSFSQFRATITLYEIINEPRLKTEPFVMCFLFFLSLKSTLKKSLLSDGHIILQSINAGFKTAILVLWVYCGIKCFIWNIKLSFVKWFHIISCFHLLSCVFLCHGWTLTEGVGVPISKVKSTLSVVQWLMILDGFP